MMIGGRIIFAFGLAVAIAILTRRWPEARPPSQRQHDDRGEWQADGDFHYRRHHHARYQAKPMDVASGRKPALFSVCNPPDSALLRIRDIECTVRANRHTDGAILRTASGITGKI
jgi:hypothetical protein